MNIYAKLAAITAEINAVAKNLNVDQGKSSYKAVGEADVLAAVKPAEEKYKVYSFPVEREIIDSAVLTTSSTYNGEIREKKQQYMRVRVTYRFVNVEAPEEYVDMITYGDGVDPQDKAPGKAMTYADKYALLKAYKIITGDDPDQKASADLKDKEPAGTPKATERQIAYIKKMCNSEDKQAYVRSRVKAWDALTMADATQIIGDLKTWSAKQG